jgi:hypothetical protein
VDEDSEDIEIDDNEDELDDLEKPDAESDELDQGDEEEDEVTDEEPEESDGTDEDNSEEDAKTKAEEPTVYKYKANDQEFEFTEDEIKSQFGKIFAQAMDYTKKTQELKPWRTQISALKDNNISPEDINLMIDVLKGDKDAISSLLKKTGVDALELDTDGSEYTPKEYGKSEKELDIQEVIHSINRDPEYKITEHVIGDQWDEKSRNTLVDNPEYIKGLHIDIKNGTFDKVSPMAMKLKVMDGGRKSDIEYYLEAGGQYVNTMKANAAQEKQTAEEAAVKTEKIKQVTQHQEKQKVIKSEASKRKAAAPTNKSAGKKGVVDYLDDSDEAFDEWYKNMQDKD